MKKILPQKHDKTQLHRVRRYTADIYIHKSCRHLCTALKDSFDL